MGNGENILSVVFLALICIVISTVVGMFATNNSGLIIPTSVFVSICLWIVYDYMLINRYKAKEQCMRDKYNLNKTDELADELADELLLGSINDIDDEPEVEELKEVSNPAEMGRPKKENPDEFDIDMYNSEQSLQCMHKDMGCGGDTMLCNRMKYMGLQPQLSKDIRSAFDKYTLQPYFEEELREQSEREWWNSDHLESEF
jgi:hypothetical protein